MLIDVQGFRPFDILPNELVVKIFTLTLAIGERHCKKPPSRGLLSHVCRRWKDVLQTHVCIAVPGYRHLTLSKYGLESGYVSLSCSFAILIICAQRVDVTHLLPCKICWAIQTFHRV